MARFGVTVARGALVVRGAPMACREPFCFMPDHLGDATGQPHFMLGMAQEFEIAGR